METAATAVGTQDFIHVILPRSLRYETVEVWGTQQHIYPPAHPDSDILMIIIWHGGYVYQCTNPDTTGHTLYPYK